MTDSIIRFSFEFKEKNNEKSGDLPALLLQERF